MKFLALIAIVFSLSLITGCQLSVNGEDVDFEKAGSALDGALDLRDAFRSLQWN